MEQYDIYFFDVDGTLAESKQSISHDMSLALSHLAEEHLAAIISGGGYEQMRTQVIEHLPKTTRFSNLYMLPTSGSALYTFSNGSWKKTYAHSIASDEITRISEKLVEAIEASGVEVPGEDELYGERIEYRDSQVSWSAYGQEASLEKKKDWDPDHAKRRQIIAVLAPLLPEYEIKSGGTTTIDITQKGINKGFAVEELARMLGTTPEKCVYAGDALFEGGNDEAVIRTGINTRKVLSPEDTQELIHSWLKE